MERVEGSGSSEAAPLLENARRILNKYDNPDQIGHVLNVKDKDPGQLARMFLNITN